MGTQAKLFYWFPIWMKERHFLYLRRFAFGNFLDEPIPLNIGHYATVISWKSDLVSPLLIVVGVNFFGHHPFGFGFCTAAATASSQLPLIFSRSGCGPRLSAMDILAFAALWMAAVSPALAADLIALFFLIRYF